MRVAVILALLPLARSTSEEFAEASNEGECALLQSSAVRTRAFNAAEMTEMSTEHLDLRAQLAGMSAANLTSHTVCDLHTLNQELQGKTCQSMPKTVLIHIPKTAGTAVELAGFMSGVPWGCHMSFTGCARAHSTCFAWHVPPSWMTTPNLYEGRDAFCVTRDPYERALSEYRYFNTDCRKSHMNAKLTEYLEAYKDGDVEINGCHLVPQAEYVWGRDGRQWCQSILRLEEFPQAFDNFIASRSQTFQSQSIKLHQSPINYGHCQDLSVDDISNYNIQLINEIYHEDFQRLNYAKRTI
mmetsp:Transcript_13141/g.29629  ORF Transcript_13141/g.29629 Transcript_13141/m.29629 type:complete len:298 (-) Transcript_13141:87-980(-)